MTTMPSSIAILSPPTDAETECCADPINSSFKKSASESAVAINERRESAQHFIAGAMGGMCAAIITSPLEVVKTRLQIKQAKTNFALYPKAPLSTLHVMRSIARNESILGLWRGISPTLIGVIPARAAYFGLYNHFKDCFASAGAQGTLYNFLSAAGAGSFAATATCPIWVVKTRLQLLPAHSGASYTTRSYNVLSLGFPQSHTRAITLSAPKPAHFASIRQVAYKMYKTEGPRAFFRGLTASYWGISESALQLAMYEESKRYIGEPNNFKLFLTAGITKLVASALTYPHEVVRTRMRDQRAPLGSVYLKYRSMLQSIGVIFKEEGAAGLYGGLPAHLMRVVPNAAIMFLVVEILTRRP